MKKYYLAYGSNLNVEQMKRRCPQAKKVGSFLLEDYELEFRLYLTIKKSPGCKVPIGVWEITESDEMHLDRYEGYPSFYRKEYLKAKVKGKEIEGLVYIMNESVRKVEAPTGFYMDTCIRGYQDFNFDTSYLLEALTKAI